MNSTTTTTVHTKTFICTFIASSKPCTFWVMAANIHESKSVGFSKINAYSCITLALLILRFLVERRVYTSKCIIGQ